MNGGGPGRAWIKIGSIGSTEAGTMETSPAEEVEAANTVGVADFDRRE